MKNKFFKIKTARENKIKINNKHKRNLPNLTLNLQLADSYNTKMEDSYFLTERPKISSKR